MGSFGGDELRRAGAGGLGESRAKPKSGLSGEPGGATAGDFVFFPNARKPNSVLPRNLGAAGFATESGSRRDCGSRASGERRSAAGEGGPATTGDRADASGEACEWSSGGSPMGLGAEGPCGRAAGFRGEAIRTVHGGGPSAP